MFTGIIEEIGIVLAVGPGEITVGRRPLCPISPSASP